VPLGGGELGEGPVTVAVKVTGVPKLGLLGLTDTVVVVGALVTDMVVEPYTEPYAAEMVVPPTATAVASPDEEMVATPWLAEAQVTDEVTSVVLPSVKVPVAVNCWV
jgi:hypothetical protein